MNDAAMAERLKELSFYSYLDLCPALPYLVTGITDATGAWSGSMLDYIQCDMLGMDGSGLPEQNLIYIKKGLELLVERKAEGCEWTPWYKKCLDLFGNEQSAYFFWYWCDSTELMEVGYSVPGWLSEKGKTLLKDLQIAFEYEDYLNSVKSRV